MKSHARKLLCAVLALSMVLPFASCNKKDDDNGNDSGEKGPTIPSVSELSKGGLGVDEPGQEIDSGFEAPTDTTTNAQQSGSNSYTIYEGFTVTMPIDINDYLITTEYGTFFKLYTFATDLGWKPSDYAGQPESTPRYEYANGDMTVLFSYEAFDEVADGTNGGHQISDMYVDFVLSNDFATSYYKNDSNPAHNNAAVQLDPHYEIDDYRLDGKGYYMSHDDIVLMAYILWACTDNPNEDPLANLGISSVSHGTNANGYKLH